MWNSEYRNWNPESREKNSGSRGVNSKSREWEWKLESKEMGPEFTVCNPEFSEWNLGVGFGIQEWDVNSRSWVWNPLSGIRLAVYVIYEPKAKRW